MSNNYGPPQSTLANLGRKTMNISAKGFDAILLVTKLVVVVTLLALSYVNTNTEFIQKEPKKFLNECIIIGAAAALSIFIIFLSRAGMGHLLGGLSISFTAFLLFFVLNLLSEYSGLNQVMSSPDKADEKVKGQFDKYKKQALIAGAVIGGLLLFLAVIVRSGEPPFTWGQIFMEGLLFGSINAGAMTYAAKNRGDSDKKIGTMFAASTVGLFGFHLLLQGGGFYRSIIPFP